LEKEAKGCWQEEKEERVLGLLSQFWFCGKVIAEPRVTNGGQLAAK